VIFFSKSQKESQVKMLSRSLLAAGRNVPMQMGMRRFLSAPITIEMAKKMPKNWSEIPNEDVVILAKQGLHEAREERLRRNIMVVDNVDYEAACTKLDEINAANDENAFLMTLPYKVGAFSGLTAAVSSVPLVFSLDLATWFAANVVHEDPP
jgi:hypothetical protein